MRNRYVLAADLVLLAAAAVGAFVLRFNLNFLNTRQEFWFYLAAAILVKVPVFYAFGLYHRYWRHAHAFDAIRVVVASTTGSIALAFILVAAVNFAHLEYFSRAVLAMDWMLTVAAVGGIRFAMKLEQGTRNLSRAPAAGHHRVLVVGAGTVGTMVARLFEQHAGFPMRIVGFIDDDPAKRNKVVYGHRVLGPRTRLERLVSSEQADEVVIAMPSAPRGVVDEICQQCDGIGVETRVIPSIPNLLQGTLSIDDLRQWRSAVAVLPEPGCALQEQSFERILVAGGAGFIGANFVRYLLSTYPSSTVVVLDKLTYAGNPDNLLGLEKKYAGRYFFVRGDICDKEGVQCCIDEHDVEAVVNFAAESHVDRSLYFPDVFLQTNVIGTHSLLEAVRHRPRVRRFHQVSTDEVYGEALRGSFSEDDPIEARSPYSASKAGSDMLVLAYAASYGVSATITRASNNIGPYQHLEKAVPLFTTSAIDGEPLPVYGDGLYIRDYQYVLDHCRGIDAVMRRGVAGEIYNLGGGQTVAAIDLAKTIVKKLGRPESLIRLVADRAGQDRRYSLNCAKAKALGWSPRFSLEEALDRTIEWYLENEWWWRKIKTGEYREYYERQLKWRLETDVADVSLDVF